MVRIFRLMQEISVNNLLHFIYRHRSAFYISLILVGLYLLSFSNYLLFHTFAEMIAVATAGGIFMIAWNSRHFSENGFLLFLGISFLFTGVFDLLHALTYKGTGIFPGVTTNLATQLWLCGRYLQSISFLAAPLFLTKKLRGHVTLAIYFLIGYFLILLVFYLGIFPMSYGPHGLTPFKKISEYIIIVIFALGIYELKQNKERLSPKVLNYLVYYATASLVAEFLFTIYVGVYDFYNMTGHLLRILAYIFIYKAVVESNLKSPYSFLFKNLKENEEALRSSELRFRSLITAAINAVILANKEGNIVLWNDAATQMFGYSEEEMMGKPISIIMPEKYRERHLVGLHRVSNGGDPKILGKTIEMEGLNKNGKVFPVDISISSWTNHEEIYYGAIIRDITDKKETEKKFNNALVFSQGIIDTVWQPLIILDRDLRIFSANKSFYDFFKIGNKNIIGKNFYEIDKHEWNIDELKTFLYEAFETRQKMHGLEITRTFPRIGKRILLLTANPLKKKPSSTKSDLILLSIENVTYYRETQEKMAAYTRQLEHDKAEDEALLSNIGDAIVAVDTQNRIRFVNKTFEEITGLKSKNVNGKILENVLPLYNKKGLEIEDKRPTRLALETGQKFSYNAITSTFYLKKVNKLIPIGITATPIIVENRIVGAIGIYRDVSKEKEIDKAKNEFISLASHQMRTPLTSINLSAEMILNGITGEINEDQREYLNNICRDVKGMAELIEALLNVSRIELGTFSFDLKPTNVLEVADSAVKEIHNYAKSKRITIEEKFPTNFPMVVVDKNLLKIIFQNLLSNAVKYTPEEGRVEIEIKSENHAFLVKVSDTGVGIPKDQKDKVFLKMFRAKNVINTGSEGIGLGLYAIKSLIEQIGGKIWFESKEHKGTNFFVQLPFDASENRPSSLE